MSNHHRVGRSSQVEDNSLQRMREKADTVNVRARLLETASHYVMKVRGTLATFKRAEEHPKDVVEFSGKVKQAVARMQALYLEIQTQRKYSGPVTQIKAQVLAEDQDGHPLGRSAIDTATRYIEESLAWAKDKMRRDP
ncbi:MAG: hypothetical protein ABI303_01005 [Candidatus Saccharimonas sp.]